VIKFDKIPPWPPSNDDNLVRARYYTTYQAIINNFDRCCKDKDVLFIDNTNLDGPEVVTRVAEYRRSVIFNLLDPPYTWHYLQELLQKKDYILVGTDSPHIAANFWLAWAHSEFPRYTDQDLEFKQSSSIFLNYNYKPHEHRLNLIRHMNARDLQNFGIITTNLTQIPHALGRSIGLGDITVWQQHFLNIVSETVFKQKPELIINEKTLKPLLGLRPFIINGSPRYYDILESWGIDIFDDIWPISDMRQPSASLQSLMDRNHSIICDVVEILKKENLQLLYQKLLPRLQANRQRIQQLIQFEYQRLCVDDIDLSWRTA
jgi:hypothetical protein